MTGTSRRTSPQNTLARTYLAWSRVQDDEGRGLHPDRYAHRILVRAFIDETRRPWWRHERPASDLPDAPAPSPLDPVDRRAIRDALAQLPPNQRAAVVLRHLLELDVDECADLLGCPAGTVRTRTHRGLLRLRTLLTELDAEGVRS